MDERLKPYEEKMQKSYDFLVNDLGAIRADAPIPMSLTRLRWIIMGRPHRSSRWEILRFPRRGCYRLRLGRRV